MKKRYNIIVAAAAALFLVSVQPALADLVNGDFSEDFTGNTDPALGWAVTTGPVDWADWSVDAPAAFFRPDGAAASSTLRQWITVDPGFSMLSFDVLMETEFVDYETDVFTAFLDTMELYTLSSSDLISDDVSQFEDTVICDVSSFVGLGSFELVFNLAHDNTDGETTVLLDNVALVPVPGAVVLGGLGLSLAGWRLRKRRPL